MKKLTHVTRAVLILGLLLLLKGNPSLVTAQLRASPQGQKEETSQPETRRQTPGTTLGRRFQRISAPRGIKAIPLAPVVLSLTPS